jgi:hypothetical protein
MEKAFRFLLDVLGVRSRRVERVGQFDLQNFIRVWTNVLRVLRKILPVDPRRPGIGREDEFDILWDEDPSFGCRSNTQHAHLRALLGLLNAELEAGLRSSMQYKFGPDVSVSYSEFHPQTTVPPSSSIPPSVISLIRALFMKDDLHFRLARSASRWSRRNANILGSEKRQGSLAVLRRTIELLDAPVIDPSSS